MPYPNVLRKAKTVIFSFLKYAMLAMLVFELLHHVEARAFAHSGSITEHVQWSTLLGHLALPIALILGCAWFIKRGFKA